MRLIDADALITELNGIRYPGAPYVDAGIRIAIGKVCDAPTIEERKTGKWSVEFSPAYKGGAYCECSQCNYKFAMGAYFEPDEWKFCPNCGADMRGEQDGSD